MNNPRDTVDVEVKDKYNTVVSTGQSTLKAHLIMNGGASVAFLSFIGKAIEQEKLNEAAGSTFTSAMQWFILGTFCAVFAYGLIFATNCLSYYKDQKIHTSCPTRIGGKTVFLFFILTPVVGSCSLLFFLVGSLQAMHGFSKVRTLLFSGGN